MKKMRKMEKNTQGSNKSISDKADADSVLGGFGGLENQMNPTPNPNSLTGYKAAEMLLCAVAIILGLLYLYTDIITLDLLLPIFSFGMAVITLLRYLDTKVVGKRNGKTAKLSYLPTAFAAILTLFVIGATLVYFRG